MADTGSIPVAEGGRPDNGGPNWVVLGVVGVGGILLLSTLLRSQKGSATTAAGTSINAALGSVEEENMNIMGQIGQSEAQLSKELGSVNDNVITSGQITSSGVNAILASLQGTSAWNAANLAAVVQAITGKAFGAEAQKAQLDAANRYGVNSQQYLSVLEQEINKLLANNAIGGSSGNVGITGEVVTSTSTP